MSKPHPALDWLLPVLLAVCVIVVLALANNIPRVAQLLDICH